MYNKEYGDNPLGIDEGGWTSLNLKEAFEEGRVCKESELPYFFGKYIHP